MPSKTNYSRRAFLALTGVTAASLAGCADRAPPTASATQSPRPDGPVEALQREAISVDADAVASRLAEAPIVGIGETSHGVAEFKSIPGLLVRRLVRDHGYRLLAVEGTLGEFAPVDAYVAGEDVNLDDALSSLEFYFWRTADVRQLFEWLREFNRGRPDADRVVVRGYDAQFHDVNAAAIRSYLRQVDPEYLSGIDADLAPLTEPLYEQSDPTYLTDARASLVDSLRDRFRARRSEYAARSSATEWRLARRHVWTMDRGLRFLERLDAEAYTEGKRIRDAAMAANVAWLRDWADADRAVVLGNANHTMRNDGGGESPPRMGQHLTDEFGADYYSLGLLFGTGEFSAPANHVRTAFETYDLGGPVDHTLEATLTKVGTPRFFLDFDAARQYVTVETLLNDTSTVQFSVPRAATKGAVALPVSPGAVFDGIVFVRTVSPASFVGSE
jgi:erythromycin esterase